MEFGLLGPLTVRNGDRLLAIPQGKPRALLAVLLVRAGQVVPAGELIELIWDGSPPRTAPTTLLNHVKRLRRSLGEPTQARIRTSKPGYLIEIRPGELDLTMFGALCHEGSRAAAQGEWERAAAQLRTALALWRGLPLMDIPCPLLAVSEVPRLEELRASALEDRINADMHLGRHYEVIAELQQLAATDRLRERVHALLMLALYRAGRRAGALAAYQAVRGELVIELGLEPGNELRSLHQQILTADPRLDLPQASRPESVTLGRQPGAPPANGNRTVGGLARAWQSPGLARPRDDPGAKLVGGAAAAPTGAGRAATRDVLPRQLPHAGAGFAGRRAEREALTGLLGSCRRSAGTVGICVIGGGAGIGKTTLAVHWAHQAAGAFPGGQLYVDLGGFGPHSPAEPAQAVRGFLGALGIPATQLPAGEVAQVGLYRSLLASRRLLIVLDNATSASQVRPLLPASPGSLVVITSRNRLTGLAAAEGALLLTLDPLTEPEAHELLTHRLGPERMVGEDAAVTDLIRLCAGLPLALAAAAARITSSPGLPAATVARELTAASSPLDALDTGDPATSLRPMFSWSFRDLSARASQLFGQLAIQGQQNITVPGTAALARLPKADAHRLLTELTDAYLMSEHPPGRFTIHPLLRAYATEQTQPGTAHQVPWAQPASATSRPTPRPGPRARRGLAGRG